MDVRLNRRLYFCLHSFVMTIFISPEMVIDKAPLVIIPTLCTYKKFVHRLCMYKWHRPTKQEQPGR